MDGDSRVDQFPNTSGGGEVNGDEADVIPLTQTRQLRRVGPGANHHSRPFGGEAGCDGESDAPAPTGDDGCLAARFRSMTPIVAGPALSHRRLSDVAFTQPNNASVARLAPTGTPGRSGRHAVGMTSCGSVWPSRCRRRAGCLGCTRRTRPGQPRAWRRVRVPLLGAVRVLERPGLGSADQQRGEALQQPMLPHAISTSPTTAPRAAPPTSRGRDTAVVRRIVRQVRADSQVEFDDLHAATEIGLRRPGRCRTTASGAGEHSGWRRGVPGGASLVHVGEGVGRTQLVPVDAGTGRSRTPRRRSGRGARRPRWSSLCRGSSHDAEVPEGGAQLGVVVSRRTASDSGRSRRRRGA